jgi:hypothetical protein
MIPIPVETLRNAGLLDRHIVGDHAALVEHLERLSIVIMPMSCESGSCDELLVLGGAQDLAHGERAIWICGDHAALAPGSAEVPRGRRARRVLGTGGRTWFCWCGGKTSMMRSTVCVTSACGIVARTGAGFGRGQGCDSVEVAHLADDDQSGSWRSCGAGRRRSSWCRSRFRLLTMQSCCG